MEIRTEIEIDAPAERVWAILTDFDRYPAWNPLVVHAFGPVRAGERLRVTVRAGRTMKFTPEVVVADSGRELRWRGVLLASSLFSGEHYFRLEPRSGGVRFVHGEQFSGWLLPILRRTLERDARPAFERMNRALKERAEGGS